MNISENVLKALTTAGWFEGREIDTTGIEQYLIKSGYEVFPTVKKFLKEFGMIEIVVDKPENQGNKQDRSHTNPEKAISNYYTKGSFEQEEKFAGEKLVPVGQIRNEYQLLLISESGKVYCDTGKLGDNAWEAWETIINRNGFKAWGHF